MPIVRVLNEAADVRVELLGKLGDLLPAAFPHSGRKAGAWYVASELTRPGKPCFSFGWPGIDGARHEARVPGSARLVPDRDASVDRDVARDILVEGDNREVLKILKAGCSGTATLINLDPPFSTGKTSTCKNGSGVPEPGYLRATGQIGEPDKATTSHDIAGRKHAPWLTMMFSAPGTCSISSAPAKA